MDERIKTCPLVCIHSINQYNINFSLFVVSVLLVHFHFKVILKSLYQHVLACETKDISASVNKTLGPFPSTSNFKRPFVIHIFNLYFKPHDALKRIFLSFLSGENHWDKCERSGKRVACGLRWKTNKPSIKRQLGSLRKQQTFCDAITGLPTKWHLRNECRNSILMTRHFLQLGSASDWPCHVGNLLQPIRSTTQIWVVLHHQYGISAFISQLHFAGKPVVAVWMSAVYSG